MSTNVEVISLTFVKKCRKRNIGAHALARRGRTCNVHGHATNRKRSVSEARSTVPDGQGVRNPPDKKIVSAAVITTRSYRALSRLKSATEANNSASNRIRVILVIVVINSSLLRRPVQTQGSDPHSFHG